MGVSPRLTDTNLRAPRREALGHTVDALARPEWLAQQVVVAIVGVWRGTVHGHRRRCWHSLRWPASAWASSWSSIAFRFNREGSGTEALLMRTIGVRDLVLGSGACVAWASGGEGELRRWASMGLLSDGADLVTGLRSKPLVGEQERLDRHAGPGAVLGRRDLRFRTRHPRRRAAEFTLARRRGPGWAPWRPW